MLRTLYVKQSSILFASIALLSFSPLKSEVVRSHHFDIRDKNIGVDTNPTPITECLEIQAITGQSTTIYRNSAVEPSIAVNPLNRKEVVAAFQEGRINTYGGSLDMVVAHSQNGGHHWNHTTIPFQNCNGGFVDRVSNVWLSYGPDGKVYMIASVFNSEIDIDTLNQSGVIASVSNDNGQTWSNPHWLIASENYLNETTLAFPYDDKTSITADPNNPGFAYAVWNRFPDILSSHSDTIKNCTYNGGLTWCSHETIYNPFHDATFATINNGIYNDMSVSNNIIVVLPNGDLLNFMTRTYAAPGVTDEEYVNDVWPYQFRSFDIAFIRSTDNGDTWDASATQVVTIDGNFTFTGGYEYDDTNTIIGGVGNQTRTEGSSGFFDVAVNPSNGYLYVVFQSGEFAPNQLPQIALVTSRDGGLTWSTPARVSRTPLNAPNPQAFTPAVAVTDNGYVGILYHDFRKSDVSVPTTDTNTRTNVWFAEYKEKNNPNGGSTGIGLNYIHENRVSKDSYSMQIGPVVDGGIMTNGDYNDIAAMGHDFYAVYVKSIDCPLMPAQTIVDDVDTSTILLLDNNRRTAPFFSRIDAKK